MSSKEKLLNYFFSQVEKYQISVPTLLLLLLLAKKRKKRKGENSREWFFTRKIKMVAVSGINVGEIPKLKPGKYVFFLLLSSVEERSVFFTND